MAPSHSKQPKDTRDVKKKGKDSEKPKVKDGKDTAEGKKVKREEVLKGIQKVESPGSTASTAASSAVPPRRVSFKQPAVWTPENRTKSVVSPEVPRLERAKSSAHLGEKDAKMNDKKDQKAEKKGEKPEKKGEKPEKKGEKPEKKDKKERKDKKDKKDKGENAAEKQAIREKKARDEGEDQKKKDEEKAKAIKAEKEKRDRQQKEEEARKKRKIEEKTDHQDEEIDAMLKDLEAIPDQAESCESDCEDHEGEEEEDVEEDEECDEDEEGEGSVDEGEFSDATTLVLGGDQGNENESSSEQSESDEDEKNEDKVEDEGNDDKEESKEEKVPPSILKKGTGINDAAENGKSIPVKANSTLYKYQALFLYYLPYMLHFLLGFSSTSSVIMLVLHQGKTHKKEYDAFYRQLNDRKKFPIALSEYAHRSKQDLFNMWLENNQDFRQFYSQLSQSTAFEAHICLILMAKYFKLSFKIGGIISYVI